MSTNVLSYLPNEDEEQRKLRVWGALTGKLPAAEGGGPAYDHTPPEPLMAPPRMTQDEFPDPEPFEEMPPDAPPLAKLGQSRMQQSAQELPEKSSGSSVSPWALLADAMLNKGRGIGSILALSAAGAGEDRELDRDLKRAQAERLRNPQGRGAADPYTLELRRKALELQERGLTDRAAALLARNNAAAERQDPTGKMASSLRAFYAAHDVDMEGADGLSYEQLKLVRPDLSKKLDLALAPDKNEAAADRAMRVDMAKGAVEDQRAEQSAENEGLKSRARAEATLPSQQELKRTPGAPAMPTLDPSTGEPVLTPQQQLQRDKDYRASTDQYFKETKFDRGGALAIKRAEEVLAQYPPGADLPASGMIDSRKPSWMLDDNGLALRSAQNWMNNAIQRADSGAAAPIPEELAFKIRSGAQPGATEREMRVGLAAAREHLRGNLRGASAGKERAARDVLGKNGGLDAWALGNEQAPANEARRQESPSAAIAPDDLGDTGQRRSQLPLATQAGEQVPKQMRLLQTPAGRKVEYPLTDSELQKLLSRGFKEL